MEQEDQQQRQRVVGSRKSPRLAGDVPGRAMGELYRPWSCIVLCTGILGGWYLGVGRGAVQYGGVYTRFTHLHDSQYVLKPCVLRKENFLLLKLPCRNIGTARNRPAKPALACVRHLHGCRLCHTDCALRSFVWSRGVPLPHV